MSGLDDEHLLFSASRLLLNAGRSIEDGAVLVRNGRIARVGARAELVRDASAEYAFPGCCLLPGLIDAHAHLSVPHGALKASSKTWDDDTARAETATAARLLVAAGVTTVRDLGGPGCAVQDVRDLIARGAISGPRLVAAGRPITIPGGHLSSFGYTVQGRDEMATAVHRLVGERVDVVKLIATGGSYTAGTSLGKAQFSLEEMSAGVQAAHGLGRRVACHAHGTEGIARAVASGVDTIEHCSWMDLDGEIGDVSIALAVEIAERGQIPVIAGPFPDELADELRSRRAHRRRVAQGRGRSTEWLIRIWQNAGVMRDRGLRQGLGTDSMFGQFGENDDLAWRARAMVEIGGWRVQDVLRLIWEGNAAALGEIGQIGALAAGARADIVVLGGDPKEDIAALHDVVAVAQAGHLVSETSRGPQAVHRSDRTPRFRP